MKKNLLPLAAFMAIATIYLFAKCRPTTHSTEEYDYSGWREYLGGPDRNHYSSLTQITPDNIQNLRVAWVYEMADSGQIQTNAIVADGVLYGITPSVQAFALDAATGKEIWRFGDPLKSWASTGRGVTYWSDGKDKRILHTIGPKLYALNAETGQPVPSFGQGGAVDLHTGLGENAKGKFVISNTPGTLFEDLIIMPVRLSEESDAAPGDIRAFNVRTGALKWSFHTIPHPGEYGYDTWPTDAFTNTWTGAANNWAGMAVDRKRGIVYVPTGSAAYDFYGGHRRGENLFANCLLALDARTGRLLWHFQFVHHDLWDRDLPAPPNLLSVRHNGQLVDAVAQITKLGYVYLFDRVSGEPLFPIREVPVPASDLPGEKAWETQPIPEKPAPYARQVTSLTEEMLSPYAENRAELAQRLHRYRKRLFDPPSKEGTVIFPGFDGGAEWGGAAADPQDGILYVNSSEMAWILTMVETPKGGQLAHFSPGEKIYAQTCASCHGANRSGNAASGYPALTDIGARRDRNFVTQIVTNGKGMMPGFPALKAEEKQALVAFLFGDEKKEVTASAEASPAKTFEPYRSTGYNKFLDSNGLPAIAPPWGTLNAIDLNTGDYLWSVPLGEIAPLKQKGIPTTGTENYGGPLVTASGLLFIAATKDEKFRAFDKKTGKLIWETTLPASAFATPTTYQINGKQYVVIACGGTKLGTKKGNKYMAFALP